jgi:hypothetical protein
MKCDKKAWFYFAALWCGLASDVEAFTLQPSQVVRAVMPSKGVQISSQRLVGPRWATGDDMDEDDDEDDEEDEEGRGGPLGNGVDSVSWLPSVVGGKGEQVAGAKEVSVNPDQADTRTKENILPISFPSRPKSKGAEILPLFPLGGFVYTPNTEHVLNIFEPRYRQMYTDILMNGSKRFVVTTSHPTQSGRFAQTGVLFELQDLREVSGETQDRVKYICNHKVTGRVTIKKILNPEAWTTRETYLKVEGIILDDSGKKVGGEVIDNVYGVVVAAKAAKEEGELRRSFSALVKLQHELEEDVRFTLGAVDSLAVKDGPGIDGLWQTVRLWQSFADQRLMSRQNELQQDFQKKLQEFLKKEKGLNEDSLPR